MSRASAWVEERRPTYVVQLANEEQDVLALPFVQAVRNVQLAEKLAELLPRLLLGLLVDLLEDVDSQVHLDRLIHLDAFGRTMEQPASVEV